MNANQNNQAGKGDKPRSCFSQKYRNNYDKIKWSKKNEKNTNNSNIVTNK
jgi:hypothetical protein